MSVVIETTLGDITVDLFLNERPRACLNFLKLCKIKYYNYNLFHTISRGFIAQTGDPTGRRSGGESIFAVIDGPSKKYFEAENEPRIKHTRPGLISFVGDENNMIASQFFLTLGEDLTYLDEKHCVFGKVVEGFDLLENINEVICDNDDRPYQDVRITHTVILDDPYPDPRGLRAPSRSPSPSAERLAGGRIAPDEEVDEMSGKSAREVAEMQAEREAKARATILEMVGDIPDADMAPPENVLFVCKLNPATNDDDLEIIFSRFGKIKSCEVIRDRKSGDSLQYAFIEFEDQKSCEDAYFKMDNVLIDDRRLHVDFSQSVSKVKWLGKGRGVTHFDDRGNKRKGDVNNDKIGKGEYKLKNGSREKSADKKSKSPRRDRDNNGSPRRKNVSPSPERFRRRSRSPIRKRRESNTPENSESPVRRRKHNRSPDNLPRRNDQRYSPKRFPRSREYGHDTLRRNNYSAQGRFGTSRQRSRSNRSPVENNRNIARRQSRSPRRKSISPPQKSSTRRSSSAEESSRPLKFNKPERLRTEEGSGKNRHSKSPPKSHKGSPRRSRSLKERSESPEQSKPRKADPKRAKDSLSSKNAFKLSLTSDSKSKVHKSKEIDRKSVSGSRDRSSEGDRQLKGRSSVKTNISKEKAKRSDKQKSDSKVRKSKSKSKKSKKYESSEESSSDSEEKKKKSKKKVVSSTDSSSSEESSSSSDEDVKSKVNKRKHKKDKKKSKKTKRRKSSSSSDSSSDSESSSSSSSSDNSSSSSSSSSSESDSHKKKKSKKKN